MLQGVIALDLCVKYSNAAILHATAFEDATRVLALELERANGIAFAPIPYGIGLYPKQMDVIIHYPMKWMGFFICNCLILEVFPIPYEMNSAFTL